MEDPKLFLKRYLISLMMVIVLVALSYAFGTETLVGSIFVMLFMLISLFIMLYGMVSSNTDFYKYVYGKSRKGKKGFNYLYAFNAIFTIGMFIIFFLFYLFNFITAFLILF